MTSCLHSQQWSHLQRRILNSVFHIVNHIVNTKHRKNCESCPSQVTWKAKFKCQICLSCLSSCLSCPGCPVCPDDHDDHDYHDDHDDGDDHDDHDKLNHLH